MVSQMDRFVHHLLILIMKNFLPGDRMCSTNIRAEGVGGVDRHWKTPENFEKVKRANRRIAELTSLKHELHKRLDCDIIGEDIGCVSVTAVKKDEVESHIFSSETTCSFRGRILNIMLRGGQNSSLWLNTGTIHTFTQKS